MPQIATANHFRQHGIVQNTTNWADGVAFVTQVILIQVVSTLLQLALTVSDRYWPLLFVQLYDSSRWDLLVPFSSGPAIL